MAQGPLAKVPWRSDRAAHLIFFLGALVFHLILFAAVASWVVFRSTPPPQDPGTVYISSTPSAPAAPIPPVDPSKALASSSSQASFISTANPGTAIKLHIPFPIPTLNSGPSTRIAIDPASRAHPSEREMDNIRVPALRHTVIDLWHRSPQQILQHDPTCKFPVYIASYANGDWACNTRLDKQGNIVGGAIPDLVAKIGEWTHGAVKGEVMPRPLDIGSGELLAKLPPFIFFTGHKDFVLTAQEIDNLRAYLQDGGLIWGDNALAGTGSRFDVAFRREMKRVVPDADKNFVPYTLEDDLFTKGRFHITQFPSGMNYFAEPPQHLDLDGIVAILYTPNDYSDMMYMRINPDDASVFMTYKPQPPGTPLTNMAFVEKRDIFYRNFDLQSSLAVHRLGMNIVTYLLVRFDDILQVGI